MIGLASSSVFLKAATEDGHAPSRSWGFDYGSSNDINDPGELVIGGYNSEKASYEDFTNYTVFPDRNAPCPLQVQVKGFKWGKSDLMEGQGMHGLLEPKGFPVLTALLDPFMACIEPAYWSMIMPLAIQNNWNKTLIDSGFVPLEQTWEYFKYNTTSESSFPTENIQITLDKGFTIDIPPNQFYEDAVKIDDFNGGFVKVPGKNITLITPSIY